MAENEALFLIPCNLLEGFKSCISHGKCFDWAYWTYIPSQAQVATLSITVSWSVWTHSSASAQAFGKSAVS